MNENKKDINFPINENTLNRINQSASLIFSNLSVSLLKEDANWTFNAHYLQFEDGHGSMILQKKIDSLIQYSVNKAFELETMLQLKINFENSKSNEQILNNLDLNIDSNIGFWKKVDIKGIPL